MASFFMILALISLLFSGIALLSVIRPIKVMFATRKSAGRALFIAVATFVGCGILWNATLSPAERTKLEAPHAQQKPVSSDERSLETLRVGDTTIHVGDLADDVFPVLASYKASTQSGTDPTNPSSLAVKHLYRIDGKEYTIELRRREDPGPYRVFKITGRATPAEVAGASANSEAPLQANTKAYRKMAPPRTTRAHT